MIPELLKTYSNWVGWRYETRDGKPTKPPIDPNTGTHASVKNPATWASFETARAAVKRFNLAGVGFMLEYARIPLVALDLDHCIDKDGFLSPLADWIVKTIGSYSQISPSGRGIRIFAMGDMPENGRKNSELGVEMYEANRYLTVTNRHIPTTPPTIEWRPEAILQVHERVFGNVTNQQQPRPEPRPVDLTDQAIIHRAMKAKNSRKFLLLWNGDTSGYPSQSEADVALCCLLAFWTGGDAARIDRIFRSTKLLRGKWDTVHSSADKTYGQMTISRALSAVTEYYNPKVRKNGRNRHHNHAR